MFSERGGSVDYREEIIKIIRQIKCADILKCIYVFVKDIQKEDVGE